MFTDYQKLQIAQHNNKITGYMGKDVRSDSRLTISQIIIAGLLVGFAVYLNRDNFTLSYSQIMSLMPKFSLSTIKRAVKNLERCNYLKIEKINKVGCHYTLMCMIPKEENENNAIMYN